MDGVSHYVTVRRDLYTGLVASPATTLPVATLAITETNNPVVSFLESLPFFFQFLVVQNKLLYLNYNVVIGMLLEFLWDFSSFYRAFCISIMQYYVIFFLIHMLFIFNLIHIFQIM